MKNMTEEKDGHCGQTSVECDKGVPASICEVVAMSLLVFSVLPRLPSMVAIFVLSGVFSAQAFWDGTCCTFSCNNISPEPTTNYTLWRIFKKIFFIGVFVLLLVSVVLLSVYGARCAGPEDQYMVGCGLPFCLLGLAAVWSSKVQEQSRMAFKITKVTESFNAKLGRVTQKSGLNEAERRIPAPNCIAADAILLRTVETANFKANFIYAIIRIILYPFVSYIIFRYAFTDNRIDPFCLHQTCSLGKSFQWKGQDLAIFLIQILSSFFGYAFMWISCTMVLHHWGLAFPLYLCTPISVGVYFVFQFHPVSGELYFSLLHTYPLEVIITLVAAALLWFGQMMLMCVLIWKKKNLVLANDADMFLSPRYDGVFLEQHAMLNRQLRVDKSYDAITPVVRPKRHVFVCSTMYQEDRKEMKELLSSIYQLACHFQSTKIKEDRFDQREKKVDSQNEEKVWDHFESHIFLDNGANGTQLTYFALQLFSLFEETLHMDPNRFQRINTPYGIQLRGEIEAVMPIYIHLKDSIKIKNKKRWSQVMYMNYVLNFRVKNIPPHNTSMTDDNTFILTTDADIKFTPKSATTLLGVLDSDPRVGAACGRTHPKGSGPLYWYQVFEYAIGHWFLKVAEHILGTVLCCPGCFSVFRCSALKSVLDEYSTEVTSASEFLTKDMGEDRWLCTLLVEKGWKLEYCPASENYTHCPESFDEFFKQRRRWIPSTIANLSLLITQASKITKKNENVSILFVMFEIILVFSTAISPATVILVIASGIFSAFNASDSSVMAIIVILSLLSIMYGVYCLYGNPQHQLKVAKYSTFLFSIFMGVVFAGNIKAGIYDFVNVRAKYGPCAINALPSMYACHNITGFMFPLTPSNMYLILFTILFIVSGLFHLNEFHCLIHGVWYFIALPSGYLILIIYSVANLNSRSWGTREGSSSALQNDGFDQLKGILSKAWQKVLSCFIRQPPPSCDVATAMENEMDDMEQKPLVTLSDEAVKNKYSDIVTEVEFRITDDLKAWLRSLGIPEDYNHILEQHGYFNCSFVAGLKAKDLQAMGLTDRGYVLRLEQGAQKLAPFNVAINQTFLESSDVGAWLNSLELQGYQQLFEEAGYTTTDDLQNLEGLRQMDLEKMGISKRAHFQRLLEGISKLTYPTEEEKSVHQMKILFEKLQHMADINECRFWDDMLDVGKPLRPLRGKAESKLTGELKTLRNTTMACFLLINIMWIVLLYTLQFPELQVFNLPTKAFELFYLAVYALIVFIQFCALVFHRTVTFIRYLANIGSTCDNCGTLIDIVRDEYARLRCKCTCSSEGQPAARQDKLGQAETPV